MDVEERKLATIAFADLVGSTELGGSQDPERTRMLLSQFYDAMAEENERAPHAALAMLHRTRELDERLELHIGVNTGEIVVGRAREGSSLVTGDPVNVAARLEQGAEPGEILVGERTAAAVRGAFEFGEPATIEA